jgi:hypothetical protein
MGPSREEHPVGDPQLEGTRCSLQHPELMAEDEDLEVLGAVVPVTLSSASEEMVGECGRRGRGRTTSVDRTGASERESGF